MRRFPTPRRVLASATHPVVQVMIALAGVMGGAALIGRVALGVAIVLASFLILMDALFRNDSKVQPRELRSVKDTHTDVIENYRRAP